MKDSYQQGKRQSKKKYKNQDSLQVPWQDQLYVFIKIFF